MKSLNHISRITLAVVLGMGLSACSGGNAGSTSSGNNTNTLQTSNIKTFSGTAVDSYISGATVCLDKNVNGKCDSDEPTAPTDTNGKFTFTDVKLDNGKLIPIIVRGGTDTATNQPFQGSVSNIINTDDIATNKSFVVSQITDLVTISFMASKDKSSASLANIKNKVASSLHISVTKIDSDPMKDKELFAKAQEVEQTKKLILTATANSSSLNANELAKSVKEAMVTSMQGGTDLNSTKVITKLKEVEPTLAVPSNQIDFIANQTTEIKKTLTTMVTDITITTDTLNQQEKNLEIAVESASTKIEDATDSSVITVVKIVPVTPSVTTPIATTLSTPPAVPAL